MAVTSAIVLYAITWFMTMLIALPIGLRTQGDEDDVVEGTHAGAPANYSPRRKAIRVTIVAFFIWLALVLTITYSGITWHDLDWTANLPAVGDS